MASHTKVVNLTSGNRIKRNQALGRVEQCLSEWVEENVSIRDLTLRECIARRSEQVQLGLPLAKAETGGTVFDPPADALAATRREKRLAMDADVAEWVLREMRLLAGGETGEGKQR